MKPEPFVFGNFQRGIGDSPYTGLQEVRNLNITGSPGAASLTFKLEALTKPPTVTNLAYTVNTATDVFTVASTSGWYESMAITLNTVVTSTGISTGRVYWVGNLTATTFKLYTGPGSVAAAVVDVTGANGSGTLSSYTMTAPLDKAIHYDPNIQDVNAFIFILDDSGRVWWIKNYINGLTSTLVYLGNDTLTSTNGNNRAIAVWKGYLLVFRSANVDYLSLNRISDDEDFDGVNGWVYGWDAVSAVLGVQRRAVLVGQDDVLYFQNGQNKIGSYAEVTTFDPTSGATYTDTPSALDLPKGDDVLSLGELGRTLLVGTKRDNIYPWDRESSTYSLPLKVPEHSIARILTANNIAYIFAGNTGTIYWTNGSTVGLLRKIPDHLSGVLDPYFTWGDALTWRNQLYFSFTATQNDGTTLSATAGVWAIDTATGALRQTHQPSHGTNAGSVPVLLPHVLAANPPGEGLYVGWSNSGTYGVDITSTSKHTSYSGYAISELRQVGSAWAPRKFEKLYLEFSKPLASGQGIRIYYRNSVSDAFTLIGTFDYATFTNIRTFEKTVSILADKIQLKAELTTGSSSLSPEFLPITLL